MSVWQSLFLRGAGVSLFMLWLARRRGQLSLSFGRRDWALMLGRAAGEAAGAVLFVSALFHMPLGNLSAILQALPLTVTLAGVLFLRERLGWRRSLSVWPVCSSSCGRGPRALPCGHFWAWRRWPVSLPATSFRGCCPRRCRP
jgi:drug/metabolite transporter (DMT)-like permease